MLRRIARFSAPITLTVFAALVWPFGGCNESNVTVAIADEGGPPLSFGAADAAGDGEAGPELTAYCPSDKCPEGFTTCPNSKFPCDVDLKTDIENCGACGSACAGPTTAEIFECVEGRCALRCQIEVSRLDCDGIVDNGCETVPSDPKNCGTCGNECTDPAKPCVRNDPLGYQCGCEPGKTACGTAPYFQCVDLQGDDFNCGRCDKYCETTGPDGGEPPTNAYYGCSAGDCGHLKCRQHTADCDSDQSNGCETSLTTNTDCGACGKACPAGKSCYPNALGIFECLCAAGQTYCNGECVDLASDPDNCGACGYACDGNARRESVGVCTYGTCERRCVTGRADCNGNPADDCETNTNSDPDNCGGCGIVCDAIAGQACVRGRCAVEPCAPPDGGPAAR